MKPSARRKKAPASKSRKALEAAYKASHAQIPARPQCPRCGLPIHEGGERHHPAGRRKAAFCFYAVLHHHCHQWVHANPREATEAGLLWGGRNSKEFTYSDADALVKRWPFPQTYPLAILQSFSPTKYGTP